MKYFPKVRQSGTLVSLFVAICCWKNAAWCLWKRKPSEVNLLCCTRSSSHPLFSEHKCNAFLLWKSGSSWPIHPSENCGHRNRNITIIIFWSFAQYIKLSSLLWMRVALSVFPLQGCIPPSQRCLTSPVSSPHRCYICHINLPIDHVTASHTPGALGSF